MGRQYYILSHIGAWLIMILPTYFLMFGSFDEMSHDRLVVFISNVMFTVLNFYLFFSILIPQFYDKKKASVLVFLTLIFLVLYPLLQYEIFSYLHDNTNIKWKRIRYKDYFLSQAYTSTVLYTGVAYLAYFTIKWMREKQNRSELITQNQASELALLRSQINPHFLFNTLNNIYSLVLRKSDVAPEAMMKLSEIMRYMLYETNTDKVPLEKEVKYLESYIELLSLRMKQKGFIKFDVQGTINNQEIAPMLLVPFVENAFKHSNKKVKSPGIKISLEVFDEYLSFSVINNKKTDLPHDVSESGGIGLQNIRRRLNLLYASKHKLDINEDGDTYHIVLIIRY